MDDDTFWSDIVSFWREIGVPLVGLGLPVFIIWVVLKLATLAGVLD